MRRLDHRDANEPDIIAALERRRCLVQKLSGHDGVPDLLVACAPRGGARRLVLLEVKDGAKKPSARALRETQEKWHAAWAGAPVFTVTTVAEAIAAVRDA